MLLEKFQLIGNPYPLPRFAAAFSQIPVIKNQNGKTGFLKADSIIFKSESIQGFPQYADIVLKASAGR